MASDQQMLDSRLDDPNNTGRTGDPFSQLLFQHGLNLNLKEEPLVLGLLASATGSREDLK